MDAGWADVARGGGVVERAADGEHGAVAACHAAREFLDFAPGLAVHGVVLRADVGEVVALFECFGAPFHVGARCHVALVEAGVGVVLAAGLGPVDVGVAAEAELPFDGAGGLFGGELPRHPVGAERGVVVGGRVAGVTYDVLVGAEGRQFGSRFGRDRGGGFVGGVAACRGQNGHGQHAQQWPQGPLEQTSPPPKMSMGQFLSHIGVM